MINVILGILCYATSTLIFLGIGIFWMQNPNYTEMNVFLRVWPLILIAMVLIVLGAINFAFLHKKSKEDRKVTFKKEKPSNTSNNKLPGIVILILIIGISCNSGPDKPPTYLIDRDNVMLIYQRAYYEGYNACLEALINGDRKALTVFPKDSLIFAKEVETWKQHIPR